MVDSPRRVAVRGSCHCGLVQYIIHLKLPHVRPQPSEPPPSGLDTQDIYRCNCTICHKSAQFHVRPEDPANDFLLLRPLNPFGELGDYQCFGKKLHFFFCQTCGIRPFIFNGEGEVTEVDSAVVTPSDQGTGTAGSERVKVWRPKGDVKDMYLSLNGHTVDADQKAFDMRVLSERRQILYVDCLSEPEGPESYERPPQGGCY